ncbi:hypothetical protein PENCOP_c015G08419 [Penicillium coprophilum]|uniref:Uncharacterized protein n=1 Tax=Penicillium coprophilum TaxID=36646 RepID=A0A1V6U8G5_9EURO|nr:hypothetical protein PENCOP_c015G08419 [Penicillium coprophilum]
MLISKVLNASGMAEFIDQHFRRYDNIKETAGDRIGEDGTTDIGRILHASL